MNDHQKTDDLLQKLRLHQKGIEALVKDPQGKEVVRKLVAAEIELQKLIDKEVGRKSFKDRVKRWLRVASKTVGEKLFDKLNDAVKGWIGSQSATK